MEIGFKFDVDCCNTPVVIGFICIMIMCIVLFTSVRKVLCKVINKDKNTTVVEDIKSIEEKRDDNNDREQE